MLPFPPSVLGKYVNPETSYTEPKSICISWGSTAAGLLISHSECHLVFISPSNAYSPRWSLEVNSSLSVCKSVQLVWGMVSDVVAAFAEKASAKNLSWKSKQAPTPLAIITTAIIATKFFLDINVELKIKISIYSAKSKHALHLLFSQTHSEIIGPVSSQAAAQSSISIFLFTQWYWQSQREKSTLQSESSWQ